MPDVRPIRGQGRSIVHIKYKKGYYIQASTEQTRDLSLSYNYGDHVRNPLFPLFPAKDGPRLPRPRQGPQPGRTRETVHGRFRPVHVPVISQCSSEDEAGRPRVPAGPIRTAGRKTPSGTVHAVIARSSLPSRPRTGPNRLTDVSSVRLLYR